MTTTVSEHYKTLHRIQLGVGLGLPVMLFIVGYWFIEFSVPPSLAISDTVFYTLRWSLPMVLVVMWAIHNVGRSRLKCAAIKPLSGNDHLIQLQKNFLSNSLEQFLVALVCMVILSSYLETVDHFKVIPLFSVNFVLARIIFCIGYAINEDCRGVGMVMTYLPTIFVAAVDVYFIYTKGFAFAVGDKSTTISDSCAQLPLEGVNPSPDRKFSSETVSLVINKVEFGKSCQVFDFVNLEALLCQTRTVSWMPSVANPKAILSARKLHRYQRKQHNTLLFPGAQQLQRTRVMGCL